MAQIGYTNKVALNENPEIADINKVTDDDMNEIKQVVNDNYNNTIQITNTEPTDPDNKLWIDTGAVQNLGSEVHIGNTIDSDVGLNVLVSKNLLDEYLLTDYSNNVKYTPISVEKNTDYTLSTNSGTGALANVFLTTEASGASTSTNGAKDGSPRTVNSGNNTTLYIGYRTDLSSYWVQLEKGSTATTYEPYITPAIYADGVEIYNKNNLQQYSTIEQRIGTWIDGKPLYRKVIVLSSLPNNSSITINHNISNIDIITNYYGSYYNLSTGRVFPININWSDGGTRTLLNNTTLTINATRDMSSYVGNVIVEYTKTTD